MELEGSLPYSQAHAADIYPEPAKSSPCYHFQLLEDNVNKNPTDATVCRYLFTAKVFNTPDDGCCDTRNM